MVSKVLLGFLDGIFSERFKEKFKKYDTIRYDTIVEFNVDSKAEYKA